MDKLLMVLGTKECPIRPIHAILHKDVMIRKNWSQFVRGLGIPSDKIDKLRQDMQLDKITHYDLVVEVLEEFVSRQASDATLKGLLKVVEDECQAIGVGENIRLHFQLPCKAADNNSSIEWDDLTPAYQNQVTKNFKTFFPNVEFSEALPKLQTVELVNIMTGKKPSIYRNTIPETPSYYIRRTLFTRNIVSSDIFAQNYPDTFLFKGVNRSELFKLAKDKVTTGSREQLNGVSIKFMTLDQPNHFNKICGKTTHPVHLIERERDGRLRWIRSKGKMNNLQRFIDHSQDELDEETFCESLDSQKLPVCISDSPGMGKTLLPARIGNFISKMYPKRSVVFIALTEFVKLIKQVEIDDKIKRLEAALQNYSGYEIFSAGCKTQSEDGAICVELLVDGFDELDSSDYEFAYDIFKTIETSFLSSRLWVTSRPHLLEELERRLNVLGYNIRGFRLDDQIQFLSSYWSRNNPLDGERFQQFAQHCLKSLKSKLKSEDQDIAGIPLQCLLIGEAYEDDAKEYAARPDNKSEDPMDIETEIGTITNLYRHLINNKIKKYETTYTSTKLSGQEIMSIHVRLSLELIFPDFLEKTSRRFIHPVEENQMEDVLKVGILELESTAKRPRFLHRTFAEYYIACFLSNAITTINEASSDLTKLLFRTLETQNYSEIGYDSFTFSHPVVAYFINSLISEEHSLQFQPGSKEDIKKIIHACANANHFQTFKLFEGLKQFDDELGEFDPELLYLAIWNSGLELVTSVVTYMEQHNHFDPEVQAKSLSTAVKKGNVTVVEFLLKSKQLNLIVEGLKTGILEIIHDCVEKSKNDLKIVEKVNILQMIIGIQPTLLEKNGGLWKEKPLLCFGVHVRLLTELVRLGADVLARGIEGDTVLHMNYGRNHLSAQDYHELLLSIPEEKLKSLVAVKRVDGDTPLISILRWIDPKPETFAIFKMVGSNFNCVDRNDETVLRIAIDQERSPDTIFQLIQYGGRMYRYKNPFQRLLRPLSRAGGKKERKGTKGLLHHAAKNGNMEAVAVLLEDDMVEVNSLDEDGWTPLDHAVRNKVDKYGFGTNEGYEICLFLHERGGISNNAVNFHGQGLLHSAVINGNLQSVTTLNAIGVNLNTVDNKGNTALHVGANYAGNFHVIQYLLLNGANYSIENNFGETPFQIALEYRNFEMFSLFKSQPEFKWSPKLDKCVADLLKKVYFSTEPEFLSFVKSLTSHVVDINYQNDAGNSLLHLSSMKCYKSVVEFLVGNGAQVNLNNYEQQTPLHLVKKEYNSASLEIIKYLIEHGANVFAKDKENRTFLHVYVRYKANFPPLSASHFHSIAEYLLGKNSMDIFNRKDRAGVTPLQLALMHCFLDEETLSLLHSNQVDFNALDSKGDSVLTYALMGKRREEILHALVFQFGANPKHVNHVGQSILHQAMCWGTVEGLKFFLQLGELDVNATDKNGNAALHNAAFLYFGRKEAYEKCVLLVKHGADISIRNGPGFTPYDFVMKWNDDGTDKEKLFQLLKPAQSL